MLLMAFGSTKAQNQTQTEGNKRVNSLVVNCTGDVTIRQSDQYVVAWDSNDEWHANYNMADTAVYLDGTADFDVTLHELNHLTLLSSGDVKSAGVLKGGNLSVTLTGSGDVKLNLDYDNVCVRVLGSGDVELGGRCNSLTSIVSGSGDLNTRHLQCSDMRDVNAAEPEMARLSEIMAELNVNMQQLSDSVDWEQFERDMEKWAEKMERWGEHVEKWGNRMERLGGKWDDRYTPPTPPTPPQKPERPEPKETPKKRSLLMNPHWTGVDAGLNLLLGMGTNASFGDDNAFLELRPLRSWVFNFNIADVGIAFDRRHRVGLTTGIGLGWNNYSFNRPVRLIKGEQVLEHEALTEQVKKSKLGVLYVQAPLMLEVRPSGSSFFALGVTGGIRIDTWTKIKFQDGVKEKKHSDYYVNLLKLDATLRAGSDNLGFFASYNLLPLFVESHGPAVHPLNVGFSLIF